MTYLDAELSDYEGQPLELYKWICGSLEWFYTSSEILVSFDGDVYVPTAITRGEPVTNQDRTGQLEVTMPDDLSLVEFYMNGTPARPVELTVYRLHRTAPVDPRIIFMGEIAGDRSDLPAGTFLVDPIISQHEMLIPRGATQRDFCIWPTYDPTTCQVDPAAFTFAGTVSVVSANGLLVTVPGAGAFLGPSGVADPNFFGLGVLTFGEYEAMIQSQSGNTVLLMQHIPSLIVGSAVTLLAGDDRTPKTCRGKFLNQARMMVFPSMPVVNPWYGQGLRP